MPMRRNKCILRDGTRKTNDHIGATSCPLFDLSHSQAAAAASRDVHGPLYWLQLIAMQAIRLINVTTSSFDVALVLL